ncbi:acyl-CoA synthetase [Mycolicibacterium canariasense]|uniref:Acyl-CoA synthetase n=1 Tax=Mycolicibacterium canariasense TaxID=228230 RepID=A0A117I8T3_MYCCR|nr:AMP-binding protein [Mycolicibacterium canariasense]MCV7207512.1 AMP-binding protein [Mycolicibacterium canariasense]ORV08751.1 acyl-CoA synthetase [Mycolicibacterium canariasense]GAS93705.1 acyl-CoA synthetase [Mycolicibacterium canariasense]
MPNASILTLLQERASATPDAAAFTYTDYDLDPAGVSTTLTWAEVHRRTVNAALEFEQYGAPGDRALIIAPQGLDYIVAFLGAMQAGYIAVPLSVPVPGSHDERVSAVVADTSPVVVLTTSAVAHVATRYVDDGAAMIAVVSVDALDLDRPAPSGSTPAAGPETAYLQYTSGSTRLPAGVMISHRNLVANFEQLMADYFVEYGGVLPPGAELVSWLPFYHDMGLMLGIAAPILSGHTADLMSPLAFLADPMRWLQAMSRPVYAWSAAPNFAFDLAARRASAADMADLDLSGVLGIINGAERIHPPTLVKFNERFSGTGFRPEMVVPSYGLAEATVFVASSNSGRAPEAVEFDAEQLNHGVAVRRPGGSPLMRYGIPTSPLVRIVDADTCKLSPEGVVGEIWTHGENVSAGYWRKPEQTGSAFGATLADAPEGIPATGWLRTGDQGFISDGDLFIVGRIKDMLIVRGRNYYPEDIEATVQQVTRGRVAAIAVPDEQTEKLVTVIEMKKLGDADDLTVVKSEVVAAISRAHGLHVADVVLVAPGSIPTTTSGKIRRSACVEQHRQGQFVRLDA